MSLTRATRLGMQKGSCCSPVLPNQRGTWGVELGYLSALPVNSHSRSSADDFGHSVQSTAENDR
jgi:hypothetical protein